MVSIVEKNLHSIKNICKKYQIAKLWLFGSALDSQKFTKESDIDFLYVFDDGGTYNEQFPYAANWSNMLDDLKALFAKEIQLIAYGRFRNPYFREAVESSKKLIYDKDS